LVLACELVLLLLAALGCAGIAWQQ